MRCGVLVAVLALAAAVSTASAQPAQTYREASESLGEMATLNGRVVRFVDVEAEWNLPKGLQPKPEAALKALIRDRALNALRNVAVRELAATLMPDCPIEATQADLDAFYPYWRSALAREADRLAEMGVKPGEAEAMIAASGFRVAERVPAAEMAKVDAALPGAEFRARAVIRNWKIDHCLQTTFGGDRFFSNKVGLGGEWPVGPQVAWWSESDERAMAVPSLTVEPLTARGRFFRAAEVRGLLSFRNPADAAYFFQRYEGERYDTMKNDAAALSFLATAPWARGAPNP